VAAQVSLAFLLVSTAVLFVRSLQKLQEVDLGFDHTHVVQLIVDPEAAGYERKQLSAVYTLALHAIDAVPGVQSSTMTEFPPLSEGQRYTELRAPGGRPDNNSGINVNEMLVGPTFFRTMGIAIQAGRDFTEADDSSAPNVAAINADLGRFLFGNENPVGRQLILGDSKREVLIIAVVRDSRYTSIRAPSLRTVYEPILQLPAYAQAIEIRSSRPPTTMIGELRNAISKTGQNFPVTEAMPLSSAIDRSLARESLVARLSSLSGIFALLLACMGLYGVMAYTVARHTGEIGIRIALGASRTNVLWMELRQSTLMVLVGLAVGAPASLLVSRVIANQLFGVSPTDLVSFSIAAVIMVVIAGLASYIPCRRASRIDPLRSLRYE
jgi:predicted permease